jgi:hypothetical protein
MTILKVGNTAYEIGGIQHTGTAYARETGYATEEAQFNAIPGGSPGTQATWGNLGGATDLWCHFRFIHRGPPGSGSDGELLHFYTTSGDHIFTLDLVAGAFRAAIGPDGGATNAINGNTQALGGAVVMTIDLHVYHDGTKQRLDYYHNETLVSEASYDAGSAAEIDRVFVANIDVADGAIGTDFIHFSELLITDGESTIGLRVATSDPDEEGTHTDLTGDISNLLQPDDGSIISIAANGDRGSWTLSAYGGPSSPTAIRAVVTTTRSSRGLTGPQKLRHLLRVGGTTYDNGADITPSPAGEVHVWDNNPATAAPWLVAAFTGLEQGVEAKT